MVGVCMMLSQQLSGINAIMFYSTKIFLAAGLDEPKKGTVFVGIINVIFSGVCVVLIERFGRKVSCPQSVPCPGTIRIPSPGFSPVRLSGVVIFFRNLSSEHSILDITFDWSYRYVCNGNKCWCHNGYLRPRRNVLWWR